MFERFSESARQVVVLAQDEARTLGHDYLGTEHLLLGLLRDGERRWIRALESLEFTIEEVRAQVVRIAGRGEEVPTGQIPFTPRAKQALELSLREATALRSQRVGPEHILLGLLRVEEGVAFRVLEALGVVIGEVRALALAPHEPGADSPPRRPSGPHAPQPPTQLPLAPATWRVLALAQGEARALRHNGIAPEHLLLGLLHDPASVAARVLTYLAVGAEEVRAEASAIAEHADGPVEGQLPFTPRARRALELAQAEARGFGSPSVAPEHVLLGLVRENEGTAVAERVRRELARVLAE